MSIFRCVGLRTGNDVCDVEAEGVRRAIDCIRAADAVFFVMDASSVGGGDVQNFRQAVSEVVGDDFLSRTTLIFNKIDCIDANRISVLRQAADSCGMRCEFVSAKLGTNCDALLKYTAAAAKSLIFDSCAEDEFFINIRQKQLLIEAETSLKSFSEICGDEKLLSTSPVDLVAAAEFLRDALRVLGKIVGVHYDIEDILGGVFSRFCIGK